MPRFNVPRSTRTMYGTVSPAVVVVILRSGGVVPGVYGLKQLLVGGGAGGLGSGSALEQPASAVALAGGEVVAAFHQTADQPAQRARRCIGGERAGDVMAVEREPHPVQRNVLRHAHLDQGVAAADEVGTVRQRRNLEIGRVLSRLRRDQKYRAERQQ